MRLSENFTLEEFVKSQTAIRRGISNEPTQEEINKLIILCNHVIQPVRDAFGLTNINSGFRSLELNTAIGGSRKSQHCLGEAADIEVPGVSNYDLAIWIRDNLEFDQLILEFYKPGVPNSGWVHVSYQDERANRNAVLTAVRIHSRASYKTGIVG